VFVLGVACAVCFVSLSVVFDGVQSCCLAWSSMVASMYYYVLYLAVFSVGVSLALYACYLSLCSRLLQACFFLWYRCVLSVCVWVFVSCWGVVLLYHDAFSCTSCVATALCTRGARGVESVVLVCVALLLRFVFPPFGMLQDYLVSCLLVFCFSVPSPAFVS
jgi:hypothetical protein